MNKLEELRKAEREASNAFMYAKKEESLQDLYKKQEKARKELNDFLYGSGVNGNSI